jgi:diguanylate cyclase (GGDEF)-like protein
MLSQRLRATRSGLSPSWAAWLERDGWLQGWGLLAMAALTTLACVRIFDRVVPSIDDGWAIYWPHNGIAAAILLMVPRRRWPWVLAGFVGALIWVEALRDQQHGEVAVDVFAITAEVLIAAFALPAFVSLNQWLMEPKLALRFIASTVVGGPLLLGLPLAWYYQVAFHTGFWPMVLKWAFADGLGAALWLPLILVLFSRETYDLFRWRAILQTLLLLGALCGISWLTFRQRAYALSFLPYPLLLFVALRLGFSGAVIATNLLTLIVASLSVHGFGPFAGDGVRSGGQIALLQVFSMMAILFVFPLSITLSERRNFEQQLKEALVHTERLATIDPLTQVSNRRHFDEALESEWARAIRTCTPIALLMIDADCFKAYNDQYGHVAGDECLRQIATALSAGIKRQQDLVARYGGEEFAVLLPGMRLERLQAFADGLRASVEATALPHAGNPHGRVTMSIGCCVMFPSLQIPRIKLIEAADRALYKAKQGGRNRVEMAPDD